MQAGALVPEAERRHWGPLPAGSAAVLLSVRLCTCAGWKGAQTPGKPDVGVSKAGEPWLGWSQRAGDRTGSYTVLNWVGVASAAPGTCRSVQRVWAIRRDRLAQRPFPARPGTQTLHTAAAVVGRAGCEKQHPAGTRLETRTDYLKGRKSAPTGRVGQLLYLKFLTEDVYYSSKTRL